MVDYDERFILSANGMYVRDLKEHKSYNLSVETVIGLLNKLDKGEV